MARLLLENRPERVTSGTPAIGAGSSARTVKVSVIDNEHYEGSERFTLMQGRFLEQGRLNLQLGVDAERRVSPVFQMRETSGAANQRVLGTASVQW